MELELETRGAAEDPEGSEEVVIFKLYRRLTSIQTNQARRPG